MESFASVISFIHYIKYPSDSSQGVRRSGYICQQDRHGTCCTEAYKLLRKAMTSKQIKYLYFIIERSALMYNILLSYIKDNG